MSTPKFSHVWMAIVMVGRMLLAVLVIGAFCGAALYIAGPNALPLP